MEYNKLVSVVMPVHNGERFLREAIESVLNQTYTNYELLLIENCSTDSSVEIIKSFKDPRIRLIIEEDCGQVQAYNRGFKEAKGEYIFIHDHDDLSSSERFERQLEYMVTNEVDICGSHFSLVDDDGVEIGKVEVVLFHDEIVKSLLFKNYSIFNPTVCLKKEIFKNIGYFKEDSFPSSDYEFYLKAGLENRLINIDKTLYFWRQHKKQMSKSSIIKSRKKTIQISIEYQNLYIKGNKYFYRGLTHYYNAYLFKALFFFLKDLFVGDKSKISIRYIIIIIFTGPILKIVNSTNFVRSEFYKKLTKTFDTYIIDKIIK